MNNFIEQNELRIFRDSLRKSLTTNDIVFVLGWYGAGKSENIKRSLDQNEYRYLDLSDSCSINQALRKYIGVTYFLQMMFIAFVLVVGFWYLFSNIPNLDKDFKTFFSFSVVLTITSPLIYFYLLNDHMFLALQLFRQEKELGGKEKVILDDLERSNLTENEIWIFLTKIQNTASKMVVCLGYSSTEQKLNYLERIQKYGGVYVQLPQPIGLAFELLKRSLPYFNDHRSTRLTSIGWLYYFSARDCLSLIDQVKNHPLQFEEQMENLEKVLFFKYALEILFNKFSWVSVEERERLFSFSKRADDTRIHFNINYSQLPGGVPANRQNSNYNEKRSVIINSLVWDLNFEIFNGEVETDIKILRNYIKGNLMYADIKSLTEVVGAFAG